MVLDDREPQLEQEQELVSLSVPDRHVWSPPHSDLCKVSPGQFYVNVDIFPRTGANISSQEPQSSLVGTSGLSVIVAEFKSQNQHKDTSEEIATIQILLQIKSQTNIFKLSYFGQLFIICKKVIEFWHSSIPQVQDFNHTCRNSKIFNRLINCLSFPFLPPCLILTLVVQVLSISFLNLVTVRLEQTVSVTTSQSCRIRVSNPWVSHSDTPPPPPWLSWRPPRVLTLAISLSSDSLCYCNA